jgi:hypothetical protein
LLHRVRSNFLLCRMMTGRSLKEVGRNLEKRWEKIDNV